MTKQQANEYAVLIKNSVVLFLSEKVNDMCYKIKSLCNLEEDQRSNSYSKDVK